MYVLCIVAPSGQLSPELQEALSREGLGSLVVRDEEELSRLTVDQGPDAVLLDVAAADADSVARWAEACKVMRLPLLLGLTPEVLEAHEFSAGGDDFILWPPRPSEVTARLRQAVQRLGHQRGEEVIRVGNLVIDPHRYEVFVAGHKVLLTFKEYQLLKLLATNPGRVYTREALLSQIWQYDYFGGTRTVDVHIRRLRSKIEDAGHSFIETVWNVGYRFKG